MAEAESPEQELDDDGLVVQKYHSVVLVVVPPMEFGEQTLRYARSSLYNVHVGTYSVSTEVDELVKGRLQDEFLVDGPISDANRDAYSGILVVGSDGPSPLAGDPAVLQLLRDAARDEKLIAGWGNAIEVFAKAGVLKGHKVTGSRELEGSVKSAGGRYTGREIQVSGHVVTARDEGAGMRFGQALAEIVRI